VKFYDLGKDPITCPKCGTVFEVVAPTARARPEAVVAAAVAPVVAAVPRAPVAAEETLVPETPDAEFVSLEDADAEAQGKKKTADAAPDAEGEEDVELDESLDDAAFIEEQEEEDADVTDIIGDVEDEEET
jgi:uncharacterized protein (TIGR02300 family)